MDISERKSFKLDDGENFVVLDNETEALALVMDLAARLGLQVGPPVPPFFDVALMPTAEEAATARRRRIEAIRDYRARTGASLGDAKNIIDRVLEYDAPAPVLQFREMTYFSSSDKEFEDAVSYSVDEAGRPTWQFAPEDAIEIRIKP